MILAVLPQVTTADGVFAVDTTTGRVAGVAATASVPYWSVIENQALRKIGRTQKDVASGKVYLLRSSSANTTFTYNPGWVAIAVGKQYRISPTAVSGNRMMSQGQIGFARRSTQQAALKDADWALRIKVTGAGKGAMWLVTTAAYNDYGVLAR